MCLCNFFLGITVVLSRQLFSGLAGSKWLFCVAASLGLARELQKCAVSLSAFEEWKGPPCSLDQKRRLRNWQGIVTSEVCTLILDSTSFISGRTAPSSSRRKHLIEWIILKFFLPASTNIDKSFMKTCQRLVNRRAAWQQKPAKQACLSSSGICWSECSL